MFFIVISLQVFLLWVTSQYAVLLSTVAFFRVVTSPNLIRLAVNALLLNHLCPWGSRVMERVMAGLVLPLLSAAGTIARQSSNSTSGGTQRAAFKPTIDALAQISFRGQDSGEPPHRALDKLHQALKPCCLPVVPRPIRGGAHPIDPMA